MIVLFFVRPIKYAVCCSLLFFFFFFFQAEDGIRDAQESRGLGDVYKRQEQENPEQVQACGHLKWRVAILSQLQSLSTQSAVPVSYTHLTLPTIYSV